MKKTKDKLLNSYVENLKKYNNNARIDIDGAQMQ